MSELLLDTTILIDLSRGNLAAADFVDHQRETQVALYISAISAMELVFGCRNKTEVEQVNQLAADFLMIHLSPAISAKAYDLMLSFSKSHNLAIPDALIAATALTQGLEFATDNVRHFQMIPDLKISRPY